MHPEYEFSSELSDCLNLSLNSSRLSEPEIYSHLHGVSASRFPCIFLPDMRTL